MFVLTHVKNAKVHELTLSGFPMTPTVNFIVETEFLATDGYNPGDTFKVNNTAFTAIINPDIYGAFSANEVVHCVLDFSKRKIVVVNIHKAKFDALYVYNPGETDVTESTPQGAAMEDNKTSYITPLFFGFGDNNVSVMHNALVGYSFSIKDIWPNDNAADAYTDTDLYRFEVTVSIDLGSANGFPTKTIVHTITRRCEIVSNEFTLDNIPSGDTTISLSLTVRSDCPVQGILKNTFTFFIQCSDMATKKDIPIIYFPVPGKEDEAYMLGWSDTDATNITMPAVIPRTEYKCIGMISPRMLTDDSNGYYVNDAKDMLTPDEISLLNSYSSVLTYRIFKNSTSTPFTKLNSINFGSECRFMMLERYDVYYPRRYDDSYNGLMVPYFNFNACRNINYIDYCSSNSYTYGSPIIPGSYPLTEDKCVDIDIHPDPNLMLWFDPHSYSYSYGFGTFIHDDNWTMGQICSAISTSNRYGSTCGDTDIFRLMDIKIGECLATNWAANMFNYRAPKNIDCKAKYVFAGSDSAYDYDGYGYDARLMSKNKYGILSSTYPPEDMMIGVNKPPRNSTYDYSSNYSYSRINAPFWSSGNQLYISLPSKSCNPTNLTSYSSQMYQNRNEADRIPMKIKIGTLLLYHYLYMYMNESYQRFPFVNMDIDANGLLAYHDLNHPKVYAEKQLIKWFYSVPLVDITSSSSYTTLAGMSYFGYPMLYNTIYSSNWHGYADSYTTNTSGYSWTYISSGYLQSWLPTYANIKMHAKFKYIFAPFMRYSHHGSSSVYAFSCRGPKYTIDGEDYFIEVDGDFIGGGIYSSAYSSSYGTIVAGTESTHWKPYMAEYQYTSPDSSSTSQVRIGFDCDTVKVGGMFSLTADYSSSYMSRNINYMGPSYEVFHGIGSSFYYRPRYEVHKLGTIPAGKMASLSYTQWIGNDYSEIIHGNLKYDEIADGAIFGTCAFNGTLWDPSNTTLDLSNVGALGYMPFAFSVGIDNIEYPDDDKPIESMSENWFEGLVGSSYRTAIATELAKDEADQNFRPYNIGPNSGFSLLASSNPPVYALSTTYNTFWNAGDTGAHIDVRTLISHIHFDESKPFRYTCRVISGLYAPWIEFVPVSNYENRDDFNKLGRYIWGDKTHKSKTGEEYPVYQFKNSDVSNSGGMCDGLPDYELADHTISYLRAMKDSDIPDGGLQLYNGTKVANTVPDLRYHSFINGTDSLSTGSNSTSSPLADGILNNFYNGGTSSTGSSNFTAPLGHWISYLVVCEQIQRVKEGKLTAAQVQFPKVEICDTVECIDAFFLANFPVYFDPEHPEDFEWRVIDLPNIRRLGDYPFAFIYFTDKTSADTGKKFMTGTNSKGLTFTQAGKDLFEGNHPIKKIKFGKYLEKIPKGLEGIEFEIDPENPNFAFKDGYIYNSDYTILITGNKDLIYATTDDDDPITIPDTVEACCCWDSLVKHDRRIRDLRLHGAKFDIVDNQGELKNGPTINAAYIKFEFPPNLTRLEVTGNTNIPFDTVQYPDREIYIKLWGSGTNNLDTNTAHRFYTREGCTCGEIFTMQNKFSPYIQMTYYEYNATTATGIGYNFSKAKNYSWHHYYPNSTSKMCIRHIVQPNKNDFASTPASSSRESIIYTNRVNDDPLIDNIVISCTSSIEYISSPNHIDQVNLVNSPSSRANGTPLFISSDVDTFTTAASMYYTASNPDPENHYILYGKGSTSATGTINTLIRVPSGYTNDVTVPSSIQVRAGAFYGCNIENVVLEHKAKKWFPDSWTSTSSAYPAEDNTTGYWSGGSVDIPEYFEPYHNTTYSNLPSVKSFKPGNQYWIFSGASIKNLTINIGVCDGAMVINSLLGYQTSSSGSYTYRGVVWFENYNMWIDRAIYDTTTGTSHHYTYSRQYALDARSHIANLFIDNKINGTARNITRIYYPLFLFHNHPSEEPTHIHFPDGTDIIQLCDNALQYYYLDDTYGNPIRNCKIFGKEATKGTKNLPVWDMTTYDGYNVKSGNDMAIMVNGGEVTIENSTFEELIFGEDCVGNDVHIANCTINEFPSVREQGTIYMDKIYPFVTYKTEEDFDKFVIVGGFGSTIPADTFTSSDWYVDKYRANSSIPGGYGLTATLVDPFMRSFHFSTAERMIDLLESVDTIESGNTFGINLSSSASPVLTISGTPNWNSPTIFGIDYSVIESIDDHGQIKLSGYDTDTPAIGYHGTSLEAFPDFTDYQKIAYLLTNSYTTESRGTVTDQMATKVTYNFYPDDHIELNATSTLQEGYIYNKDDDIFKFLRKLYGKGLEIVVDCPDRSINSAPYYASRVCSKITYNTYFSGNQTPRFRYGTDYVYNSPVAYINVRSDGLRGSTVNKSYASWCMSNYTRKLIDENPDWTMEDLIDTIIDPRVTPLREYGWVKSLTFGPDVTDIEIMTMSSLGMKELTLGEDGKRIYFINGGYNNGGINRSTPIGYLRDVTIKNIELVRPSRWVNNEHFAGGNFYMSTVRNVTIGLSDDSVAWLTPTVWEAMREVSSQPVTNTTLGYNNDYTPFYNGFAMASELQTLDITNIKYIFPYMFSQMYAATYNGNDLSLHQGVPLKTIKSDQPIEQIGRCAFYYSFVVDPAHRNLSTLLEKGTGSITWIGSYAFYYTNLYMTDFTSVEYIASNAFNNCQFPKDENDEVTLTLPSVTSIGSSAFRATNLTKAYVKRGCTYGSNAFPASCLVIEI